MKLIILKRLNLQTKQIRGMQKADILILQFQFFKSNTCYGGKKSVVQNIIFNWNYCLIIYKGRETIFQLHDCSADSFLSAADFN